MNNSVTQTIEERLVRITAGPVRLVGDLNLPEGSRAVVLFAHGSGSSRRSSRNRYVARLLNEAKLATLLIDLLTPDEDAIDERTAQLRFNIDLLAERLVDATSENLPMSRLPVPVGIMWCAPEEGPHQRWSVWQPNRRVVGPRPRPLRRSLRPHA